MKKKKRFFASHFPQFGSAIILFLPLFQLPHLPLLLKNKKICTPAVFRDCFQPVAGDPVSVTQPHDPPSAPLAHPAPTTFPFPSPSTLAIPGPSLPPSAADAGASSPDRGTAGPVTWAPSSGRTRGGPSFPTEVLFPASLWNCTGSNSFLS